MYTGVVLAGQTNKDDKVYLSIATMECLETARVGGHSGSAGRLSRIQHISP